MMTPDGHTDSVANVHPEDYPVVRRPRQTAATIARNSALREASSHLANVTHLGVLLPNCPDCRALAARLGG